MAEELSDADVMQPLPAGALSDEEVMSPPKREGGLLQAIPELFHTVPKAAELLGTPQGRAALVGGMQKFGEGLLDLFKIPGKAVSEGVTPEQETEFGVNAALAGIPGTKAIFPITKAFEQGIMRPAVARLMPQMPEAIAPIVGSDVPRGVARSELAATGEPHVDAVLNSEITKSVIDQPLIDRSHSVPYTAGGSVPLDDPTMFIDWRFPHLMEVNGKVFDPADPFVIHENIEQHTMELLTKGGMSDEAAYRVSHFEFAEKAEAAWYEAHGISKEDAEAAYAPIMAEIQRGPADNVPSNLYDRPYPHDQPSAARHEAIDEPRPSEAEIAQAKDIIAKAQERGELEPGPGTPPADPLAGLRQAREFGIIGPDKAPIATDSPARAAQRAIPAARGNDDKITMTPAGEPVDAFQQRFKQWVDKIDSPEAVRDMIEKTAAENNHFPEARAGEVSPAHVEKVAEAAGMDPSKIDRGGLSTRFNNPDKIRMVEQALLQATDDVRSIADEVVRGETPENLIKLQEAIIRRDYALEYTLGLRAEWGKSGQALQEILQKVNDQQTLTTFLRGRGRGGIDDLRDVARGVQGIDREGAARVLSNLRDKRPGWVYWLWQQGLISGIFTHSKYALTNAGFVYTERVISPLMGALVSTLRGADREIFFSEPLAAHLGFIRAIPDAVQLTREAFRTGMRTPLPAELALEEGGAGAAIPYGQNGAPNWGIWQRVFNDDQLASAAHYLGIPGRSANALHTFFKVLSAQASLESRAANMASREGLNPFTPEFWQRQAYHRENPTDTNLRGAVEDAYSGAFMEKLGDRTGKWAATVRDNPVLKWLFPFQHIPMNIERQTIRYSPAAFAGPEMRAALTGEKGAAAQDLAIAKVVVGSSVLSYFMWQYFQGNGTGGYPTNPKERADWKLQDKIPNSIRIGDQWVQIERLGPIANVAKLGLDIGHLLQHYDGQDEDRFGKLMWHAGQAVANQVGSEVGFQTVGNLMEALQSDDRGYKKAEKFLGWQVSSGIPVSSFVSQTASAMDPDMRQAQTLLENLKYRIPYLRETLPPKLDPLYGEPVHNPGEATRSNLGGVFRASPVNRDPVKAELQAIDYHPTAPRPDIKGVKLTPEQYDRYQATAGPLVKEALTAMVQTPGWTDMPEGWRKEKLEKMISRMREYAAKAVQIDQPQLIEAARQARLKRTGIKE